VNQRVQFRDFLVAIVIAAFGDEFAAMASCARARSDLKLNSHSKLNCILACIIPEWKLPRPEMLARRLNLFTAHLRRTGPAEQV
jgi:hypothetical protein